MRLCECTVLFVFTFCRFPPSQDQESVETATKPTPSSCRSKQAFNLLSSMGTYVTVRMIIKMHEDGDLLAPTVTYRALFEKVPLEEKDDARRLKLHVNKFGIIVFVSPSPKALFRMEAGELQGKSLSDVIDVFAKWKSEGP